MKEYVVYKQLKSQWVFSRVNKGKAERDERAHICRDMASCRIKHIKFRHIP